MKVLLLKDVSKVGRKGEIKEVNDGFVRNFLIPNKLAVMADSSIVKKHNKELETKQKSEQIKIQHIKNILTNLTGKYVNIKVKANEKGHLFAKIHDQEIISVIKNQHGLEIEKQWMNVPEIKEIGKYEIKISFADYKADFYLNIERGD